ncbi:hypothetical protein QE152_g39565 [Popillia japonica]|uniref:TAZ-type domain-containing protein n=1 Tax=Popillia japonica TaxID=7064 RepID=A0AAW1HTV7_POPJA
MDSFGHRPPPLPRRVRNIYAEPFTHEPREKVIIKIRNNLTLAELEELAQVICDSDSEDEIPDDDADTSSDEYIEKSEHDSDSEIDGNGSDDFDKEDENSNHFITKDRMTTWHKNSLKSKFSKRPMVEQHCQCMISKYCYKYHQCPKSERTLTPGLWNILHCHCPKSERTLTPGLWNILHCGLLE